MTLDATLGPQLAGLGNRELVGLVRRMAYELGNGMARISGDLPAVQAVAAMESLREHAETRRALGDPRTRDQVLADELVDRLLGLTTGRSAQVQLVMNAEMLLGTDRETPAHLVGYGPVPYAIAAELLGDPDVEILVRRLFANPDDNSLVAMDSKGIVFHGGLRRLLFARDGETCRTPWCDAPVRHGDHVTPRARGGSTTLDGGQGLCEACNYAKEAPGWRHETRSQWPERHTTEVSTPTGHTHWSQAPPLPVRPESERRRPHPPLQPLILEVCRCCLELAV